MIRRLLLVLLLVIFASAGCAKSLRYSQEEIKDFTPSIQENIKNGEIAVGMTRLQVRYAWGGPDEVTVLVAKESGKERIEWVYQKLPLMKTRLIFTDDRLSEILSSQPGVVK